MAHHIEIIEGPDSKGRYAYFRYWWADYHPGHPAGEHRHAERGQCYFGHPRPEDADIWRTATDKRR